MTLSLTPRPHTSASHDDCLVLRDVTVAYDRHVVLRGVSADIERGQVIGVIGPNGGGKSTLLKAILGIVPLVGGTVSRVEASNHPDYKVGDLVHSYAG